MGFKWGHRLKIYSPQWTYHMLAVFIKASNLCVNYCTVVLPFTGWAMGGKKSLPALSLSLTSQREQHFICHLERNEIKEIRGCHKRTSFLPEMIPVTSYITHSNDRNKVICTWRISLNSWMLQYTVYERAKCQECTDNSQSIRIYNPSQSHHWHSTTCLSSSTKHMLTRLTSYSRSLGLVIFKKRNSTAPLSNALSMIIQLRIDQWYLDGALKLWSTPSDD